MMLSMGLLPWHLTLPPALPRPGKSPLLSAKLTHTCLDPECLRRGRFFLRTLPSRRRPLGVRSRFPQGEGLSVSGRWNGGVGRVAVSVEGAAGWAFSRRAPKESTARCWVAVRVLAARGIRDFFLGFISSSAACHSFPMYTLYSPSSWNSISSSSRSFLVCVFPAGVEAGHGIPIRSSCEKSFFPWLWHSMTCSSSISAGDKVNL